MAIEKVDFPIDSMVDLSIVMLNYQRVAPGTVPNSWPNPGPFILTLLGTRMDDLLIHPWKKKQIEHIF